jgi:hypothetical protein
MNFDGELLRWVLYFTGFAANRVERALVALGSWGIPRLAAAFSEATIDNAITATLLVESVEYLVSIGTPKDRLLKKLRDDHEVWPTYAEIRAAKLLAAPFKQYAGFELEPLRASGKHADFKVRIIGEDEPVFVEFKAIGLSDAEASFCSRMGPQLQSLLPRRGYTAFHGGIATAPFTIRPEYRAHVDATAAAAVASLPDFPERLAAVSVVAHGSESTYRRRLIGRLINEAAKQVPEGDRGWAAFFWTNGIPARDILKELRWEEVPERIAGLVLVGDAVAFPSPNVHSYYLPLPRKMPADAKSELLSSETSRTGDIVLSAIETSSGVRATLVADRSTDPPRELLRRDGARRIQPFQFMMDRDRGEFARRAVPPIHRESANEVELFGEDPG